jgi:hypothetical protein
MDQQHNNYRDSTSGGSTLLIAKPIASGQHIVTAQLNEELLQHTFIRLMV